MSEEPEQLTLAELQLAKSTLEVRASTLRTGLHRLRRKRTEGWQLDFTQKSAELLVTVTNLVAVNNRIRTLVESAIVTTEDDFDA